MDFGMFQISEIHRLDAHVICYDLSYTSCILIVPDELLVCLPPVLVSGDILSSEVPC